MNGKKVRLRLKRGLRNRSKWMELDQFLDDDGHPYVEVVNALGVREVKRVCYLVAMTFLPNPDNKPNVRHKDGDITNNRVSNLEWSDDAG